MTDIFFWKGPDLHIAQNNNVMYRVLLEAMCPSNVKKREPSVPPMFPILGLSVHLKALQSDRVARRLACVRQATNTLSGVIRFRLLLFHEGELEEILSDSVGRVVQK